MTVEDIDLNGCITNLRGDHPLVFCRMYGAEGKDVYRLNPATKRDLWKYALLHPLEFAILRGERIGIYKLRWNGRKRYFTWGRQA